MPSLTFTVTLTDGHGQQVDLLRRTHWDSLPTTDNLIQIGDGHPALKVVAVTVNITGTAAQVRLAPITVHGDMQQAQEELRAGGWL